MSEPLYAVCDFSHEDLNRVFTSQRVAFDIVRKYHKRTEEFDSKHCTGPLTRDGRLPATNQERGLVANNARKEWELMKRELSENGIGGIEAMQVSTIYMSSREYSEDMIAIYGQLPK